MDKENLIKKLHAFKPQLVKITRARTPMQIRNFVIGQYESRFKQWYQLIIECDEKWNALIAAEAGKRLAELEIEELGLSRNARPVSRYDEIQNEKLELEIQKKINELSRLETVMTGAMKEIADFLFIAETEFKDFFDKTEDELYRVHEIPYWRERLSRQIQVDLATTGRVQAGNMNALLQMSEQEQHNILLMASRKQTEYIKITQSVDAVHSSEVNHERLMLASQVLEAMPPHMLGNVVKLVTKPKAEPEKKEP